MTTFSTEDIKKIQDSGYFSADYYLANYGQELGKNKDLLEHFLSKGWQEGKNPSEKFEVSYYLEKYPLVQEVGINPLLHYLLEGQQKGYFPLRIIEWTEFVKQTGEFDEEYYLKNHQEVINEGESLLQHFMNLGWKEGYNPNTNFEVDYYLDSYHDVRDSEVNPFYHYLRFGKLEGRLPNQLVEDIDFVNESGLFDFDYYKTQLEKHQVQNILENKDLVEHFLRVGWHEGLKPASDFETREYIAMYGEELEEFGGANPFVHYLRVGKEKGYKPNQFLNDLELIEEIGIFDSEYYLELYSEELDYNEAPLQHFMRVGWQENFNPAQFFDTAFYISTYKVTTNPLIHYLKLGIEKRHVPSPKFLNLYLPEDFDVEEYLRLNPDIGINIKEKSAFYKAMWHYLKKGKEENRPYYFDADFYANFYGDLSKFKGKAAALSHWLKDGYKENRYANFGSYLNALGVDAKLLMKTLTGANLQKLNPDMDVTNPTMALISVLNQTPPTLLRFFEKAEDNYSLYFQIAFNFEKQFVYFSEKFIRFKEENSLKLKKEKQQKLLESEQQTLEQNKQQMLAKAESTYHLALMFKADPICYENLGNIALNKNLLPQAIEYYYEAIRCKATSQWPYTNLVDILLRVNRLAEALTVINNAIDHLSPNPDLLQLLEKNIKVYWEREEQRFLAMAKQPNRQNSIEAITFAIQTVVKTYRRRFMSSTEFVVSTNLNKEGILIIGDQHLPQCVHYRIEQKREQLELAGFKVTSVSWTNSKEMQAELFRHDIIIFYRVPALPAVVKIIEQAGALGKLRFYEIDDLLFDPIYPPALNSYGGYVTPTQYLGLIKSMPLMREAACLCDYAIASTEPLLKHLEPLVLRKKGFLHRNALDSLNSISEPDFVAKDPQTPITIFYGSGTLAHNSDFILEALPAIERILAKYPQVHFSVAGHLRLPEQFLLKYKERVTQMPLSDLNVYWSYLARADINLAVLHKDTVNDCKSELKWFEAACFGIPSIVSGTQNYLDVIQDGKDGFVVSELEQWYSFLDLLINNSELRKNVGLAAQERVKGEYSLSKMAENINWIIEQALEDFQNI